MTKATASGTGSAKAAGSRGKSKRQLRAKSAVSAARRPKPGNPDRSDQVARLDKGARHLAGMVVEIEQAQETLRENEERFRGLTRLTSDWYWQLDANLRFMQV